MRAALRARWRAIGHAARGLRRLVRTEPHARVHLAASVTAILAGAAWRIEAEGWRWLVAAAGMVWSAEAFNTAVERLGDRLSTEPDALVGEAKDIAAGAVLMAAIVAAAIGGSLFIPLVLESLG